jgi:hypothetical protein
MDDPSSLQRCEELWLDGGNLVIQAENTVFKVFSAILAIASPVFKDMLSVPQPAGSAAESFEGLPFVRLPETAFDVTQLLKALVYPGCVRVLVGNRYLLILPYASATQKTRRSVASQWWLPCCVWAPNMA